MTRLCCIPNRLCSILQRRFLDLQQCNNKQSLYTHTNERVHISYYTHKRASRVYVYMRFFLYYIYLYSNIIVLLYTVPAKLLIVK